MTDEELEAAVAASRGDWDARAAALGVEIGHNPSATTAADTWEACNPGTDWAAAEDNAARWAQEMKDADAAATAEPDTGQRETWDWADEYRGDAAMEVDVA